MGSHENTPVDIDPQAIENARNNWVFFTHFAKYGIVGVVVILILMAIFVA